MTRTTVFDERVTVPPIQCQPWCTYQDGHADDVFREDQCCFSEDLRIDLTLHPPVAESRYVEGVGHVFGPDHIEVSAQQTGDARYPRIEIRRDSDEAPAVQWRFRPDEARQLIDALQLLLGQLEAGR